MADEKRIVSDKKKINAKGGGAASKGDSAPEQPKKRKKLILVVALLVVLLAAGGAYFFLFAGSGADPDAEPTEEPVELGAVLVVDSVSINLAGGHYLRLGLGLQLTADVAEEPDAARALDLAIELFSQKSTEQVNDLAERTQLKNELRDQLEEAYEGEVVDVYFTDFVTQ
jgi:flagellar protein FliL